MTATQNEPRPSVQPKRRLQGQPSAPLDVLPATLHQIASSAPDHQTAVGRLLELLRQICNPVDTIYVERNAENKFAILKSGRTDPLPEDIERCLGSVGESACQSSKTIVHTLERPAGYVVVATPVLHQRAASSAIVTLVKTSTSVEQLTAIQQHVATHLLLWEALEDSRSGRQDDTSAMALLKLLIELDKAKSPRTACCRLANDLRVALQCDRVAVGTTQGTGRICRLQAISDVATFDKNSEESQAIEAALNEVILRQEPVVLSATSSISQSATLAHQRLCSSSKSTGLISTPLRDNEGRAVGAWIFWKDFEEAPQADDMNFIQVAERPIANRMRIIQHSHGSSPIRVANGMLSGLKQRRGLALLCVVAVLALGLLLPVPFRLNCECTVEPVVRRFVVAPFAGTLAETLVRPGEMVKAGQPLATMDGRELRWELAARDADFNQARKKKDAAMASRKVAEANIARLEMERLELQRKLLRHRLEDLSIKSPIAGLVVSGDLQKAQGAPLTVGQSLFEIAPSGEVVFEIAIPEREIAQFEEGDAAAIRLDALANQQFTGMISSVHPRAELRDQESVFVAEMTLDECDQAIRPGMHGHARITGKRRMLGWVLFHRPYNYLITEIGW